MLRKLLWTGLYAGLGAVATIAGPRRGVANLARRDRRGAAAEEMTLGDTLVEQGVSGLQRLSRRAAGSGGLGARLGLELAEDAAFLRKLKPSLIVARARGGVPTAGGAEDTPSAPSAPQLEPRRRPRGRGPNPWLVIGAAFAVGIFVAKVVDWRSHAHPRG